MVFTSIYNRSFSHFVCKFFSVYLQSYTDVNLGVSLIADQFNINPSQLSRSFKKHKGIGLLDYIHSVRIEHIKELLAGNMTINDIALRTGYYNSLAMIRVYKRYEQVTPGKYREQLRKQQ